MDNTQATEYLGFFLGKRLRLHTADTRMFIGDFKCTDNVSNGTWIARHAKEKVLGVQHNPLPDLRISTTYERSARQGDGNQGQRMHTNNDQNGHDKSVPRSNCRTGKAYYKDRN